MYPVITEGYIVVRKENRYTERNKEMNKGHYFTCEFFVPLLFGTFVMQGSDLPTIIISKVRIFVNGKARQERIDDFCLAI